MKKTHFILLSLCFVSPVVAGCGTGNNANDADELGVASTCASTEDCPEVEDRDGEIIQLACLTDFKGGYCGLPDCATNDDCPLGSICVLHTNEQPYCFRECVDKSECNANRSVDLEANCSSSFDFNDPEDDGGEKACIPPSS